ncbi:BS ykrK family protein [Lapidilactobacillus concavus DSM 17758]|jgi:hypothetical protein|uniref:BS ykrK family protein n=1 Tax=Lapidilactobacillus concavus DSM 17758 TaxID=1423735 RepID=A0A0R1W8K5_9LACO|nr:DUF1836 domain-containing protein [Lapidilactobacillus concavus]KRM13938.1 BS ykrK family protein [Lapidilactobacillus concavus DSM 17758]GEL13085.1 hypothetical protein LCO01nite_06340 [Lapidilactobacillus concavus]
MENQKFSDYLKQIQLLNIPRWSELPKFDLYMDQVVSYINQMLEPLEFDSLTPAMINNYVKTGLLTAPKKKKYGQDQVASLVVIAILKSVFSIADIQTGFQLVTQSKAGHPGQSYDYFVTIFLKTIHDVTSNFHQEVVISSATKDSVVAEATNLVKLSCSTVVQRIIVLRLLTKLQTQNQPVLSKEG